MKNDSRIPFWGRGNRIANFGDALTQYIADRLFLVYDEENEVRIIGSVIDDGMVPERLPFTNPDWRLDDPRIVFWGCGIRARGGLQLANLPKVELLAVRGPISAADLRLGNTVPIGDPGLLLPAFYTPREQANQTVTSVCIPHFNDSRPDDELLALSGCTHILRPVVGNSWQGIEQFIDRLASADFILSSALHGAVTAAAYGKPFCYWDNGHVDLPLKWEDFSASLGYACEWAKDYAQGLEIYDRAIRPFIKIPSLLPLLANAPFQLRPDGMLKIMRHDIQRVDAAGTADEIERWIKCFSENRQHFADLADRTIEHGRNGLARLASELSDVRLERDTIRAALDNMTSLSTDMAAQCEDLRSAVQEAEHNFAKARDEIIAGAAVEAKSMLDRSALEKELAESRQALSDARMAYDLAETATKAEIADLSGQLINSHAAHGDAIRRHQEIHDRFEQIICDLENRISDEVEQSTAAKNKIDDLLDKNAKLQNTIDYQIGDIRDLQLDNERIGLELDRTQNALRSKLIEISETIIQHEVTCKYHQDSHDILIRNIEETKVQSDLDREAYFQCEATLKTELENALSHLRHLLDARSDLETLLLEIREKFHAQIEPRQGSVVNLVDADASQQRIQELEADLAIWVSEAARWNDGSRPASRAAEPTIRVPEPTAPPQPQNRAASLGQDDALLRAKLDQQATLLTRAANDAILSRIDLEKSLLRVARAEHSVVRRAHQIVNDGQRLGYRIAKALRLVPDQAKILAKEIDDVQDFVDQFDNTGLMATGHDGRRERIAKLLITNAAELSDLPLFDADAYLARYGEHMEDGLNPLLHYVRSGQHDGLDIHPLIHTNWYRDRYPDATMLGVPSAVHFVKWGASQGYDPHPLFSTRYYHDRYPDTRTTGTNPLAHFLRFPGCHPHPLFDTDFYLARNPDIAATGLNPLIHYLTIGGLEGRDPHPAFSSTFYMMAYPDVAAAGMNPLVHYIWHGAREGRNPSPAFSTEQYRADHPILATTGENPLIHMIDAMKTQGIPFPVTTAPLVDSPPAEALRRPIVLMVDACYPKPDRDSGSLDQIAFVRIFQELGYDVHFAADIELSVETPYRDELTASGVQCVTYPEYASIENFLERKTADIALCFLSRIHFGARHIDDIRRICPNAKIIFNTVDLHHIRELREADLKNDPDAAARAMETRDMEFGQAAKADATIVVSDQEATLLRTEVPDANVHMIPLIRNYEVARQTAFRDRSGIGFIGGFQHMPNVDAVTHFLDDIWPLVRRARPDAEFFVIGPDLPRTLLQRQDPGVTFVGFVPELAPWLNRLRMTVAPLRYGAGAKGKVVSSLAFGVPCIASPIASEGMGLTDEHDIVVGRTDAAFAERICQLDADEARWTVISDNGMATVRRRYSIAHGIDLTRAILREIHAPVA